MDFVLVLKVCPSCLSWQSVDPCPTCNCETYLPGLCSNRSCLAEVSGKFCGVCGSPSFGGLLESKEAKGEITISYVPTPSPLVSDRPSVFSQGKPSPSHAPVSHPPVSQTPVYHPPVSQTPVSQTPTAPTTRTTLNRAPVSPTTYSPAPTPTYAPAPFQPRPNYSTTDTSSILQSGISPSAAVKGISGADSDPLSRYRVAQPDNNQNMDWNKELRSASRAEGSKNQSVFERETPPQVNSQPVVRQPNPAPAPQYAQTQQQVYTSPNVDVNANIRPSILSQQNDPLDRYRLKNDAPANPAPVTAARLPGAPQTQGVAYAPTVRPSVLKDNSDALSKYRVKSPEEDERTWAFSFRNLPTTPEKVVRLVVDGKTLYSGYAPAGSLNEHVSYTAGPGAGSVQVQFNIELINFNLQRNLDMSKGRFVRFSIEQAQMKFRQQKMDLDI
eukprot:TRINITY_DN7475_c0_g1_i1.p1 TRINITY_DN7475_c0_g1~~TRINITY_DN7475_c0_g1_i1.p1  ORF type:complete len:442 (+),score=76.92 TRINITY_DN7475_c0_g1_i1:20-1345(+)